MHPSLDRSFLFTAHLAPRDLSKAALGVRQRMRKFCATCKLCPHKFRLTTVNPVAYSEVAPQTTGAGFSSLTHVSAQPRRAVFLCVSPLRASFYGRAEVGKPSGLPGAYVTGLLTLPYACPPHLAVGRGFTAHVRGRIMRQSQHAHYGQNAHLIQSIIRSALRDAALAPTYQAALDLTGDALRRLADIAKTGTSHV